jgi:hypothetical protein
VTVARPTRRIFDEVGWNLEPSELSGANHHAMTDDDCSYIGECLADFVADRGLA